MGNQPKNKRCKYGCGMIPAEVYADHLYTHEAQLELPGLPPKQDIERVRRPRNPKQQLA